MTLSLQLFATRRGAASRAQVLNDVVAEAVLAEQVGFRTVWLAEHHETPWNLCTDPLTLLAVLATKTTRIRLGAAVVNLALHHPVRVAEQAAMVNALSGGRLELGLGKGFAAGDYRRFGLDSQCADQVFRDKHDKLCELLRSNPDTAHIPTWLASSGRPQAIAVASRHGHGLLLAATGDKLAGILASLRTEESPPRIGLVRAVHTGRDAGAAAEELLPYLHWYIGEMSKLQPAAPRPSAEQVLSTFCLVGTARECVDLASGLSRTHWLSEVLVVPGIGGMSVDLASRVIRDLGSVL